MKPSRILLLALGLSLLLIGARLWVIRPQPRPVFIPDGETTIQVAGPAPVRLARARGVAPAARKDDANKKVGHAASGLKVTHQPQQPKTGQPVRITLDVRDQAVASGELALEYQIVDPGKYIALHDPAFEKSWVTVPMANQPGNGHNIRIYTCELPGDLQKHRRLVRYRIRALVGNKMIAPDPSDSQPNYAYFVSDGVPSWKGAINPSARDTKLREPVTYSSETLQRVPVYDFISSKAAVEKVTWSASDQFGDADRNAYRYTGTMVYDGIVYDHVGFRARGGGWRHAMGKNMWKFNFLPGHRFEARDAYGRRYDTKWDKLNLGACIQQADYGMRGEQGMFEAVGFRMFNLAGIEAPRTHWVHFRIIDEADESPADQYHGDFWGLYLAVENIDEHFLKEHNLPPGNVYKIDFRLKTAFNGDPGIADQRDAMAFMESLQQRQQSDAWWTNQVDLARYYNYRAVVECIHHYDIEGGKNYFYYRNPASRKWVVLPWDIDLSWGENMFGGGHDPFLSAGALSRRPSKQQYQERLAEIRDLLFNKEAIGKLIDEHAAMISDPSGAPSLVDADRAKWDYNPIMVSRYVMSMKTGQGRFYFGNPRNNFRTMVNYMKSYAAKRAAWIDSRLLGDYRPPAAPRIAKPAALDFSAPNLSFGIDSKPDASVKNCRWRLAEVTDTNSPAFNPREPWKHEIQALWEQETQAASVAAVPSKLFAARHIYRVRARWQDESGAWSRWSEPVQVEVPAR